MAGKVLAYTFVVTDDEGTDHVLVKGETVPAWAAKLISNPHAYEDNDAADADEPETPADPPASPTPADGDGDGGTADGSASEDGDTGEEESAPVDYSKLKVADLEAEIAERNEGRAEEDLIEVAKGAKKAELVDLLKADDAVQAANAGA